MKSISMFVVALAAIASLAPPVAAQVQLNPMLYADCCVRNVTIYDGSGGEPYVGSMAVHEGRIVQIGKTINVKRGGQELDGTGLCIAPGFIDLHTHSDGPIVHPSTRGNVNYLTQGV